MESEPVGMCPDCGGEAIFDFWSRCIDCIICYPRFKFGYTLATMERLFAKTT